MVQFLARVDDDILRRFHIDCKLLKPGFSSTRRWSPRGKYEFSIPGNAVPEMSSSGEWTVKHNGTMRMPSGGYFFDGDWLSFDDRDRETELDLTAKEAERIYKDSDFYTAFLQYGAFFNGGDVDYLCRMLTDPQTIIDENEKYLKWQIEDFGKVINKMGRYVQSVELASDLGIQSGPMCDPEVFQELCMPYLKKFCDFIHQNSDIKIQLHCCGSIKPFIPMLIHAGIDILNPVQISADDMDPEELKREFGDDIVFWGGGCDTQQIGRASCRERV